MGNRAECPSCKSYSSDIYSCIHFNCNDCPYCGCSYDILVKWNEMKPELEHLESKKVHKNLIDTIKTQECEIAVLKTKLKKLEDIFCWTEVLDPLIKAQNILQNNEEEK